MEKIFTVILLFVALATVAVNAQDKKEEANLLSATDEEVMKFIAAYPDFLKENKDLDPADPKGVNEAMIAAAENKEKWDAFAKEKGFTGFDNFVKVSSAIVTAFAYQLLQKSSADLEKQLSTMPASAQALLKGQLKPVKEKIDNYAKMITPETLTVVENHKDEIKKILISPALDKKKRKIK